jgi:hypothetical protein
MAILQWGVGLFLGALLVHLLLWRLHKPAAPIKALLLIFVGVSALGLAVQAWAREALAALGVAVLPNVAAYLHTPLFCVSMGCAYIVCYTVLEWDSPTLTIVLMLARAGRAGIDGAELLRRAGELPFLDSRMQDLLRGGILVERDGRFVLAPGRHLFYRSILLYSRLLRMDVRSG